MANQLDSRGQEATIQVVVDGDHKRGSFLHVENFKLSPDASIQKNHYLGAKYAKGDLQIDGHDFSFTTREVNAVALKLWFEISRKAANGEAFPQIDVVVIKNFRDPADGDQTYTLPGCILKLDDQEIAGRKEYMKNAWTGFAGVTPDEE